MAEFIFKSTVIPFEIKDIDGNILASYPLDVGHLEQTKRWIKEMLELQKVAEKFSKDETFMDELANVEKNVIVSVFGESAWKELWELFNTNVYVMLSLVQKLSGVLNEQQAKYYKTSV